ncbi:MAG: hypothetical protein ACPF9D_06865, partial [Owenweeksia sp.]
GTYVNELCENKDQPELHCNGTCQLAEKLNLETPEEKPALPEFESLYWYMALPMNEDVEIGNENSTSDPLNQYYPFDIASVYLEQPNPPPIV